MKFPLFFLEIFNPVLSQKRFIKLDSIYNNKVTAKYYPDIKVLIQFNKDQKQYIFITQYDKTTEDELIFQHESLSPCPDQL